MDFLSTLLNNDIFLLGLVVLIGGGLGRITIQGISLGISGALFVGLAFGAWGYKVPNEFFTWNLMLFVVAVGLLAAEDTARVIKMYGFKFVLLSGAVTSVGALVTLLMGILWGKKVSSHLISGTFTGAFTSSPGLGAALEATAGNPEVTIGHALAYPFGVIAVVLFVQLIPIIFQIDLKQEKEKLAAEKRYSSSQSTRNHPESKAFCLLSFAFCILGGIVLGGITLPIGRLGTVGLGSTGGALCFALLTGGFEKIGPFRMKMDRGVLSAIRSISLGFFLAIVGINAGSGVVEAVYDNGILLILVSVIAAIAGEMTGFLLGHYLWKINWIILAGAICGAMTSTPGLGAAIDSTGTDEASAGYGGAYPVAIVCMVFFTTLLHRFFQ